MRAIGSSAHAAAGLAAAVREQVRVEFRVEDFAAEAARLGPLLVDELAARAAPRGLRTCGEISN